jgi:hypothetical protein
MAAGLGERFEDRADVAGEELAVGGQREPPVWPGAQQGGADGGLELADLAGEDGVPDAELAGCVVEAGLAGEGEKPADALLGAWAGEGVPDVRGKRGGSAEGTNRGQFLYFSATGVQGLVTTSPGGIRGDRCAGDGMCHRRASR